MEEGRENLKKGRFDLETVDKLLGVDESYKAPDALFKITFDKTKREKLIVFQDDVGQV